MNLYFRFIVLLITRAVINAPISILETCKTTFRVNFLDLDLNLHMNNGRYFSIMDLGRFDLMLKSKTFWTLMKKGYMPVVKSETMRFKKPLGLFESFDLQTTIESLDDKYFYIRQTFVKNEVIYAEGYIKGCFLKRGQKGPVATKDIFAAINIDYPIMEMTDVANAQTDIEELLIQEK